MGNMNKIATIIVTYNRLALLKEEVEALRMQTYKDLQMIVVNNGSTDETPQWIEQQEDIISIHQENVGGAGGFFTGIKYAAENGYEYCWIMDDDVICQPTALEELVKAYKAVPNVGFVCSRVIGTDGQPMNTPFADMRPSENGYSDIFDHVADYGMVKVQNATFVSVFFHTDIVREVGLPIKEFFIWGDDTEYTGRISAKHPCYVACRSVVMHKRSLQKNLEFMEETEPKRLDNYFYYFRNNLYIIRNTQGEKAFRKEIREKRLFAIRRFLRGDKMRATVLWRVVKEVKSFLPQICFPS
jgi:GT2 family glycosyltransferase